VIPAQFDYYRPQSLDEAVRLLAEHGEEAKVLAGGHSLLPAMKLRLAQPKAIIDLSRMADLAYIREQNGRIAIGAMATHHDIESSALLAQKCPLLPEAAKQIGDVQVRNRGTLIGSLVHADPAADWPAAILALDAEIVVVGIDGKSRTVRAADFFVDLYQTALQPNEIVKEVRVASTGRSAAYIKTVQQASGFAIAGVAVVIHPRKKTVFIGVTGISAKPYRAKAVEAALAGKPLSAENISVAAAHAADEIEALSDIHASAEFRKHLARVNTRRALELAASRL
jgi:carbon-monoxide dehydrogenase medium subunit